MVSCELARNFDLGAEAQGFGIGLVTEIQGRAARCPPFTGFICRGPKFCLGLQPPPPRSSAVSTSGCRFVSCLDLYVQMHELGIPSFMNNTLECLNIGTYHDIATVSHRVVIIMYPAPLERRH